MTDKINQDRINKALWATCDPFSGTISTDSYKDFILAMLFLKHISDVWQDHYEGTNSSPRQGGGREGVLDSTAKLSHDIHKFKSARRSVAPGWQGL